MGTAATLIFCRTQRDLLGRIWRRVQADDCIDLAAQISFYFSLSLLPFCLVLAAVVGWLPSTLLWKSFATWIVTYLPRQSQHLIFSTILGLSNYSGRFLSLGLITAMWSASSGFVSLMESLSVVYVGRDSRSFIHKHAIAACVTLLSMVFALGCFGVVAIEHWGSDWFGAVAGRSNLPHLVWRAAGWGVTLLLMCLGIDAINFVLPDVRRRWRWLTPGSAFVVLTMVAASGCFNLYIQHFTSYPRLYGALGGFIILMLWIYIASLIVLVGAEADRELDDLAKETRAG